MQRFFDRLKAWAERVVNFYKTTRAQAGLLLSLILVLGEIVGYLLGNDVAVAIAQALWWFAKQPMGVGGLVFLAVNLAFVGYAYVETMLEARREAVAKLTSPVAASLPESAPLLLPPLSDDEHRAINEVRSFWREVVRGEPDEWGGFRGTWHQLVQVVANLQVDMQGKHPFTVLVKEVVSDAQGAYLEVAIALKDGSRVPLKGTDSPGVRERLIEFFVWYMYIVRWLHEFPKLDTSVLDRVPHQSRHAMWRKQHEEMKSKLKALTGREFLSVLKPTLDLLLAENEHFDAEKARFERPIG